MSELVFEGTLIEGFIEQSGISKAGKNWNTLDFGLNSGGEYAKEAYFNLFGEKSEIIKQFSVGDKLSVKFNLESRRVGDRVYTKATAWKIDLVEAAPKVSSGLSGGLPPSEMAATNFSPEPPEGNDLPF